MAREVFAWDYQCLRHNQMIEPQHQFNLSAGVIARLYVCPFDGEVIITRSDGAKFQYTMEFLALSEAEREERRRLIRALDSERSGGDGA